MKAYIVDVTGFEDDPSIVAAKSRGQARMLVAISLHEFWIKDMGRCLKQIKSVKRSLVHDSLIDQNDTRPRYLPKEQSNES